jgi:hypothetical protein
MPTTETRSSVRTHHDTDEIQEAIALDRLRQMAKFSKRHTVSCDCRHSKGYLNEQDCTGLSVYDLNGKQCATFRGHQYRALEDRDGSISVFSTLVRN